jgi:hypothetical protein
MKHVLSFVIQQDFQLRHRRDCYPLLKDSPTRADGMNPTMPTVVGSRGMITYLRTEAKSSRGIHSLQQISYEHGRSGQQG